MCICIYQIINIKVHLPLYFGPLYTVYTQRYVAFNNNPPFCKLAVHSLIKAIYIENVLSFCWSRNNFANGYFSQRNCRKIGENSFLFALLGYLAFCYIIVQVGGVWPKQLRAESNCKSQHTKSGKDLFTFHNATTNLFGSTNIL